MARGKDPTTSKPDYSSHVPAVAQASRILLALAQNSSAKMTLTDICGLVGIHKSKGYSILNTLQHFALVQRSPDTKTYALGPGLLFLAGKVLHDLDVREAVAPFLHELASETNSTALLGLISDNHVFVVAKDEGMQDMGVTFRVGHRFPLTWGAHGKSIVAFLPEEERQKVLGGSKLYFHGDPSEFDSLRLAREISECRARGFTVDLGGMKAGIRAVAAPVFGPVARLIGALVVVGTFPEEHVEGYGMILAAAARRFSEAIGGIPCDTAGPPRSVPVVAGAKARKPKEDS